MISKHFFKVLTIFFVMIILGLAGMFIVNIFDIGKGINLNDKNEVAK